MKDKTITVNLQYFCPEECLALDVDSCITEYRDTSGNLLARKEYQCKNSGYCERLYRNLNKAISTGGLVNGVVRCKTCKYAYTSNYFKGYGCRAYGHNDEGYPKVIKDGYGYCEKGEKKARGEM